MIKVIQTLSYLTSGVLHKKYIYKRRWTNPAQPKNRFGPGGAASRAGVPSQLLIGCKKITEDKSSASRV